MVRACDAAGARLFVVKQNRRNARLQLLRRAIDAGRFGRIYMVGVNVFWTRPQAYYDSAAWRGTWEFDGGAFMNQASHYVDLLDWLIGPVESVMAYTGTLARRIEVEDTGVAALKWRNGAMGTISVTMLTWPKNLEGSITILGEKGSARVGGVAVNEVQHGSFAEPHPMDDEVRDASYQTTSVTGARWSSVARRWAPTARSSAASRWARTPSSAPVRWCSATCPTSRSWSACRRTASAG
jgi:UDP-N-acetyl-2-amino-2-deoxyglucuronate dehydrogenase